jgi:hypothetical protein
MMRSRHYHLSLAVIPSRLGRSALGSLSIGCTISLQCHGIHILLAGIGRIHASRQQSPRSAGRRRRRVQSFGARRLPHARLAGRARRPRPPPA